MFESKEHPGAILKLTCNDRIVVKKLSGNLQKLFSPQKTEQYEAEILLESLFNQFYFRKFKEFFLDPSAREQGNTIFFRVPLSAEIEREFRYDFLFEKKSSDIVTEVTGFLTSTEKEEQNHDTDYFEDGLSANFTCNRNGEILRCNSTFTSILNYENKLVALNQNFNRHFTNTTHRKIFWQTLEQKGAIKNHEMAALDARGKKIYIVLNIFVKKNSSGGWSEAIGQFNDISDRREANLYLKKSEERYRTLIELTNDWIWEVDLDFRFTYSNSNSGNLLNIPSRNLPGSSLFRLIPEDERNRFRHTLLNLAAERKPFLNLVHTLTPSHGPEVVVETSGTLLFDDRGQFTGYRCICRDITEKKRNEQKIYQLNNQLEQKVEERTRQLEETYREMEAFSYSVSHDLRAPLRRIKGFSSAILEMASEDEINGNFRSYLKKINSSANYMSRMIQDMLNLTRVTKSKLSIQEINLSEIAVEIAEMIQNEYPDTQFNFRIEEDMTALADQTLIKTVLQNLISNACKFSSGEPQPEITAGQMNRNNQTVYFVRDNGVGFDEKYAHKLFAPFQRLHSDSEFPGTGIGLPTVQRIIHRHRGRIWAEGAPGQGATFYITLYEPEPASR